LAASGVDFSFTPVLDLDFGRSGVIGDRAFHRDAAVVSELAAALIAGLSRGGLAAVGKHFPGHGFVAEDSHLEIPVDRRALTELRAADLVPYQRLATLLGGVMPAHVIYPEVDGAPAGFSRVWLQRILREEIGFDGLIFSDDLSMEGAAIAGGIVERGQAALSAGCDLVLVCNRPDLADRLLAGMTWQAPNHWEDRVTRMRARRAYASLNEARADSLFHTALAELHLSIVAVAATQPPCA
jgi:beta-N-acetylhexosaminidase